MIDFFDALSKRRYAENIGITVLNHALTESENDLQTIE
jgi:hypothetical protein